MGKNFDFSGWATKANLLCSDGRIIRENAFAECDGKKVPLIWNHKHDEPDAVLGHALLENRGDGVYAYCTFNDTESGQNTKLLVQHGDVDQLSIYADKLKQVGHDVIHGVIREVSLVLAGANSGARIDTVISHSDDSCEEGIIYTGEFLNDVEPLFHADIEKEGENKMTENAQKNSAANPLAGLTEDQKRAVQAMIDQAVTKKDELSHANAESEKTSKKSEDEETVSDVFDTLTEKQKKVVYILIGIAREDALAQAGVEIDDEDDDEGNNKDNKGGNKTMKHNVFDKETEQTEVLTHSEMTAIIKDAEDAGSLKKAVLQHGIEQIDYLFPDAQTIDTIPGFIKRDGSWVSEVMNSVHKTPFSRIKSIFADLTETEARARGYVKGNQKVDEVFTLLKRITTPTTIYKKQSLDRDDVVDITDFGVVAWLKAEMRMMLNEEIARAALVGDGRNSSSNDKINEQNIRPIWTDDDVYTIKAAVNVTDSTTDDQKAKGFIKACIKSRKNYKGSGNPVMYMTEDMLTNCLLLEDANGRVIYDTVEKLATALRVRKIVPVPVMENLKRTVGANTHELAGIYVNLADYNIGADKGGAVNMFDDFDIDYNKQKYLIETRCSGALIKPYSAVAIEMVSTTTGA